MNDRRQATASPEGDEDVRTGVRGVVRTVNPAAAPLAVAAQLQIAIFFSSDGALTIDPDGAGPLFEMPIVPPLPETLNFLP